MNYDSLGNEATKRKNVLELPRLSKAFSMAGGLLRIRSRILQVEGTCYSWPVVDGGARFQPSPRPFPTVIGVCVACSLAKVGARGLLVLWYSLSLKLDLCLCLSRLNIECMYYRWLTCIPIVAG